jgi:hypothetical protein
MIFEMCNQIQVLNGNLNASKSENLFGTFDSSYTNDSVLLKYDGIYPRIKLCMFQENVCCVRFEVFTAVTMKNAVFWDVTPCGSCKNRRFRGTQHLHHQGDKNR